jgi:hypothetical protein
LGEGEAAVIAAVGRPPTSVLEPIHLALDRPVAPRQSQRRAHRCFVLPEARREVDHLLAA